MEYIKNIFKSDNKVVNIANMFILSYIIFMIMFLLIGSVLSIFNYSIDKDLMGYIIITISSFAFIGAFIHILNIAISLVKNIKIIVFIIFVISLPILLLFYGYTIIKLIIAYPYIFLILCIFPLIYKR